MAQLGSPESCFDAFRIRGFASLRTHLAITTHTGNQSHCGYHLAEHEASSVPSAHSRKTSLWLAQLARPLSTYPMIVFNFGFLFFNETNLSMFPAKRILQFVGCRIYGKNRTHYTVALQTELMRLQSDG